MKISKNIFAHKIIVFNILFLVSLFAHFDCSSNNKNSSQENVDFDNVLEFYSNQSDFTDPGKYKYLYEGISDDIPQIVNSVQGVILNLAQVENENIPVPDRRINNEIHLDTVEKILKCLSIKENRPLPFSRSVDKRSVGICTHYVLLTCSILRYKGIPARSRGGFEMYYSSNKHHDHWICEYWNVSEERWVRIDPEITDIMKKSLNINFNSLDLPKKAFMSGAEAWKECRSGEENPNHFGVMGNEWVGGWDFVLCEMILDFLALNKIELLPWEENRLSEKSTTRLTNDEYILLDKASELVIAGDESFKKMRIFYKSNKELQK